VNLVAKQTLAQFPTEQQHDPDLQGITLDDIDVSVEERQLGLFQGAGQLECRPLQLPTRRTMPAAAASAT